MATFTFGLLFAAPRKGHLPGPPIAHICLNNWTRGGYKGEANTIFITHRCLSFQELRDEIRRLKGELDRLEARARRRFEAAAKRSN